MNIHPVPVGVVFVDPVPIGVDSELPVPVGLVLVRVRVRVRPVPVGPGEVLLDAVMGESDLNSKLPVLYIYMDLIIKFAISITSEGSPAQHSILPLGIMRSRTDR